MARKKDNPAANDQKLFDWAKSLLDDGRQRRISQEAQWWENMATWTGDLWTEFDVTRGELVEIPKAGDHKVRIPVNLAQPVVRTEYAKLIKNRPILDCLARSNDRSDLNAAAVGDKLLNNYAEKHFNFAKVRRRALHWVLTCGFGGIFTDYDESLLGKTEVLVGPNGDPIFDPQMIKAVQRHYRDKHRAPKTIQVPQGDLVLKALSPFQLVWDFSQLYLEDASWIIVSEVYDVDEVWRRWEFEVEGDKKAVPAIMERRMLAKFDLSSSMQFRTGETQQLVEVHRLFIKPRHRYFPNGAEIVFTNKELIAKTNYPYMHEELPVSGMGHIPLPVSQHPMSILQQIRPLVLEISKTESQMIENRNLMSNPAWLEFRQNRIKGEIQNKPGMRLTVDWMPNVPEPHPIEMPDLPSYTKDLVPILKEHILEVSGQGETSQGRVPAGARSGVAIAYLQEEDDTKLGPTVMEFEEMVERVAYQIIRLIAQFYDAPRTIQIYRRNSEPEVFDFIGSMLSGIQAVNCQAGSALPRSKAAKQQYILDLWDRKLEQDPRKVREMLELSGGDPDEWEVDIQQAERELFKMKQGQTQPVLEWYNHPAHHYVLRRFMKSADFEELPPEVQQMMMKHDEEHSRFELLQQQQVMVQQQLMGSSGMNTSPNAGATNGTNATPQPPFTGTEFPANGASPADLQNYQPA